MSKSLASQHSRPLPEGTPALDAVHVAGLLDQLAEGGRLAVVVAEGGVRRARLYSRSGGKTAYRTPFDTAIPMLPGFEKAAEFRL